MRIALRVCACLLVATFVGGAAARSGSGSVRSDFRVASSARVADLSPFQLSGNGTKPDVAVDAEGTAHIVWNEIVPNGADVLHYCRIPRGTRACTGSKTFVPQPADSGSKDVAGPRVLLTGPDQVLLLTEREVGVVTVDILGRLDPQCFQTHPEPGYCYRSGYKDYAFSSNDNGATFAPPRILGHVYLNKGGATVLRVADQPYVAMFGGFADTGFGGSFAAPPPSGYVRVPANLNPGLTSETAVAALHDDTPVVAYTDTVDLFLRRFNAGDRNNAAAWAPRLLVGKGREPRLAASGGDAYLLSRPDSTSQYVLRRYDGTSLRALGAISEGGSVDQDALAVDDGGGVHVAWVLRAVGSPNHDELRYRYAPDGATFAASSEIARGGGLKIWYPRIAAADDGGGFAVYASSESGNGTISTTPFGSQKKRTLVDVGVAGMEVTQAVQMASSSPVSAYAGVGLAELGKTIVRVYATSRRKLPALPALGRAPATPVVTLRAFRRGAELTGGPLLPDFQPASVPVTTQRAVTLDERMSSTSAYEFTLPWQWTIGTVSIVVEINPQGLEPSIPECRLCRGDNVMHLDGISFRKVSRMQIFPAMLSINGQKPKYFPDPSGTFDGMRATSPLPLDVQPYQAFIDVSDLANLTKVPVLPLCAPGLGICPTDTRLVDLTERTADALARLSDWAGLTHNSGQFLVGVVPNGKGIGGITNGGGELYSRVQPVAVVEDERPLTSVAHELNHGIGRVHADLTCGGNNEATKQVGEPWLPNNDGALDGTSLDPQGNWVTDPNAKEFGLDRRGSPPYSVLASGAPGQPDVIYDLMSYCPSGGGFSEDNHWISVRNWERALSFHAPVRRRTVAGALQSVDRVEADQPAAAPALRIQVTAPLAARPSIANVAPDAGAPTPDQGNGYQLVARDRSGHITASAGAVVEIWHSDGAAPILSVTGRVASAGAEVVDLVLNGNRIAQDVASKHAPSVRILAPRSGAKVGGKSPVDVRWRASDADGDKLVAFVEYSSDGGHSWQTVQIGPSYGRVSLPAAMFASSKQARVRVRVQDGFHESVATSAPFVSRGAPPRVRILEPAAKTNVLAGAAIDVVGQAFNDRARELTGRALTWLDGTRIVGRGARLTILGLAPGMHRLTLSARDSDGGTTRMSVAVRVALQRPQFTVLTSPKRLSTKARRLVVRVAATFPTTLRVGATHVAVDRKPRNVVVSIKPGRTALRLSFDLVSAGLRSSVPVVIPRR